jgi:prepilin-type N-terminal cleavage/methylation domain-containing protein
MHMCRVNNQGDRLRAKAQSGMTLVEVTVALAIATLVIGGIINGYNYCTQAAQKSALMLAASSMAMQRVEETRSANWDTGAWPVVDQLFATNFPTKVVALDVSGDGKVTTPATVYTYISQISTTPPLRRIRVDCAWQYNGTVWLTNSIETCRAPKQ